MKTLLADIRRLTSALDGRWRADEITDQQCASHFGIAGPFGETHRAAIAEELNRRGVMRGDRVTDAELDLRDHYFTTDGFVMFDLLQRGHRRCHTFALISKATKSATLLTYSGGISWEVVPLDPEDQGALDLYCGVVTGW